MSKSASSSSSLARSAFGICATVEYHSGTEAAALATIEEKLRMNTTDILTAAQRTGTLPREAASLMARARVLTAMSYRRLG